MASMASSQPQPPRRHSSSFKDRAGRKTANVRERGRATMELPERFRDVDKEGVVDDGTGNVDKANFAHQSMYGMIAAQSTRVNFPGWFQHDSGTESEGDEDKAGASKRSGSSKKTDQKRTQPSSGRASPKDKSALKKHGQRLSEDQLARSFLKPIKEKDALQHEDPMTQSQMLPPRGQGQEEAEESTPSHTDIPVLDRKLEAMAEADMGSSQSTDDADDEEEMASQEIAEEKAIKSLPEVIADIFQFEEPEKVVAEYQCWYSPNVILQGYMYITEKHVNFYCYLHEKTDKVLKKGHIGKRSKHGYLYRQYWFILKGDSFCYYESVAKPFFPLGMVDLRYAISAKVTDAEPGKEATDFTITTPERVYYYRADSHSTAKDWVKQLQKVIFRSHNNGDSVKLSLPLQNIIDVEETNVLDLAETIKIRVIAGDDTFAVDEYFFTFFNSGKDALNVLNSMIEGNTRKNTVAKDGTLSPVRQIRSSDTLLRSPARQAQEHTRPSFASRSAGGASSPRTGDQRGRTRAEIAKGGANTSRAGRDIESSRSGSAASQMERSISPHSRNIQESSESFVTSSSTLDDDFNAHMSASQMLTDEAMFQRPTLSTRPGRGPASHRTDKRLEDESQVSSRESSTERTSSQPSSRQAAPQHLERDRPQLQRQESSGSGRTVGAEDKSKTQPIDIKGPGRLVRGFTMPLQHAITVADAVRSSGKRMSSYLSSSPKTYLSNISEAIAGGKRHYTASAGLSPDDSVQDLDQDPDVAEHERRFREHFALPADEGLVSVFYCWMAKTVPIYGKIYIGTNKFCFRSLLYGVRTKLILPHTELLSIKKQSGFRWGYPGMVLVIKGHEELFFDFPTTDLRNDAEATVRSILPDPTERPPMQSRILTAGECQDATAAADAAAENSLLQTWRKDGYADNDPQLPEQLRETTTTYMFEDPAKPKLAIKPKKSLRIVCLTIGSRGDVQPFIALCKGLIAEGHRPKIATHAEFRPWVEKHGIDFAEVAGDPAELMRICVENGMFTPSFILEANATYRGWLDKLCLSGKEACQDAELIIESPVAMVGTHIAEALEVPYYRAFTMPWTKTSAYPHAFAGHDSKRGGWYNRTSYTIFENVLWSWPSWQINHWRRTVLKLPSTSLARLQIDEIPFLYNVSPSVYIPPRDFCDWHNVTGYWFLDEGADYKPPEDLARFIKKARDDGEKLVYIGFGSVVVGDAKKMTEHIVEAVLKADVRCILSKGWSDRLNKSDADEIPVELPPSIHAVNSVPHDWLFKQIDAAVHHGGAGTTGASLRAGIPTLIKPFFGDQHFWASRVEDLDVGMHLQSLSANQLGKSLWLATHDDRMRAKAAQLGEQIRAENGVETAIYAIYNHLERAKRQIKKRNVAGEGAEDVEENWTFIDGNSLDLAPADLGELHHEVDKDDKSDVDEDEAAAAAQLENLKLADKGKGKGKKKAGT